MNEQMDRDNDLPERKSESLPKEASQNEGNSKKRPPGWIDADPNYVPPEEKPEESPGWIDVDPNYVPPEEKPEESPDLVAEHAPDLEGGDGPAPEPEPEPEPEPKPNPPNMGGVRG